MFLLLQHHTELVHLGIRPLICACHVQLGSVKDKTVIGEDMMLGDFSHSESK